MTINEQLFRQTMRFWATGVTVVTSKFDGAQHGMTVSSFTSVSAIPPVVCVSINQFARTHQLIEKSGLFGVSILENSQGAISETFAGRVDEAHDRFEGIESFTMMTGSPLISGGIAFFDCKLITSVKFGVNSVFFGEVVDAKFNEAFEPLLYSNRTYSSLQK